MAYPVPVVLDVNGMPYADKIVVGTTTLTGGNVDVAFPEVTNHTLILATPQNGLLNVGAVSVASRVEGVGFTLSSTNVLDGRGVAWVAFQP